MQWIWRDVNGELAQVVERPIRIRKVPGSMPGFSKMFLKKFVIISFLDNNSFLF